MISGSLARFGMRRAGADAGRRGVASALEE